ncbi:hypothetical protein HYC85_015666 [Camellia sinensis]|uniref:Uncharacterized protein n=1 Tax=Camellia sinensis TaxID=4442 RepID=A0A7J7H1B7_CAMSI|nr:hypothetical protein HYC85_015666 [Camellia sinensis]
MEQRRNLSHLFLSLQESPLNLRSKHSLSKLKRDLSGIPSLIALPTESVLAIGSNMCLVESKGGAIACMLLALFFLGTWPAILTLLERRGRLPQHTYLDYTMTNLLAAVIIAFTFGEMARARLRSQIF